MNNTKTASTATVQTINNCGTVTPTGRTGHTVENIAQWLGLDRSVATGLVSLALATGAAKNIGRHHIAGVRGRPSEVYELSVEALLTFLANRGTIPTTEVTAYTAPEKPIVPRRERKDTMEVAAIKTAPNGRPASEPLDFDDIDDTAPHGVSVPTASTADSDEMFSALAEIALLAPR